MKEYIKGDLLELFEKGEVNHILHCCNCQGVWGSGIALQIKKKYPGAYRTYKQHEKNFGLKLGTESMYSHSWEQAIFNLHAQEFYGRTKGKRYVDYNALKRCLLAVKINVFKEEKIGIPYKMASDRAGGDWSVVESIIDEVFPEEKYKIVIVEYDK